MIGIYGQLFLSFLQIGALSFGGGYAVLMLIQQQMVDIHGWITMATFADLVTISEMTPGPIAINAATFVGLQVGGFAGALVATFALVLPPCIILTVLAWVYKRYRDLRVMQGILGSLRPAIVAMVASACMGVLVTALWPMGFGAGWLQAIDWVAVAIFVLCLLALRIFKPNPILIIALSGLVGIVLHLLGLR